MKIVEITKEMTHDEIRKYHSKKVNVPDWLLGRNKNVGTKVRVTDQDFQKWSTHLKEVKTSK